MEGTEVFHIIWVYGTNKEDEEFSEKKKMLRNTSGGVDYDAGEHWYKNCCEYLKLR